MIKIRTAFVILKLREDFNGKSKQEFMNYLLPKFLCCYVNLAQNYLELLCVWMGREPSRYSDWLRAERSGD